MVNFLLYKVNVMAVELAILGARHGNAVAETIDN